MNEPAEIHLDNVDAGEIKKFAAMAARWWDPDGDFKPLHRINPLRLDYISQRCQLRGATIVDIGCGGGLLSEAMAAAGAEVTGVDATDAPLQVARLHLLESGLQVDYMLATADRFPAVAASPTHNRTYICTRLENHLDTGDGP